MKNKIISLGMLVGSVVLVDCIKEKGDKYKYLSTAPVSYMVTSGASAPSGIASKNNARFDWDAFSNTITIRCDSGYGYVENSWNLASSSPDTTITATNSNGGLYTSSNFNVLNAGGIFLVDGGSNEYRRTSTFSGSDDFTCVPLSTDAQWAGN
ncbi:hypothetical protein QIW49_06490 [Francisellaceae bacterium CB300]